MPTLRERFEFALKAFRYSGFGGRYSGVASGSGLRTPQFYTFLPGTGKDWERQAGDLWKTSAVGIYLNWIQLSWPEAMPGVGAIKDDGSIDYDHKHPLSVRLRQPDPMMSGDSTWGATVLSFLCDGNAYWLKERTRGAGVRYRYEPHYTMEPRWPEDGSAFISHYERLVNGNWERIEVDDVVHFRYGMDPRNTRKGLSPLKAQLRQTVTDNENSTYASTLAQNNGMPGLMVSAADKDVDVDPEEMDKFLKELAAKTTGDRRFSAWVSPLPVKVDKLNFTPEEMALDKLMWQPVWRIGGALCIDSLVVNLPSENRGSYDNREQAERAAWNNAILPWMRMMSSDIVRQCGPDYGIKPDSGVCVGFDTRHVRALKDDLATLLPVLVQAAGGPVLTPNEARGVVNFQKMDDGNEMRLPMGSEPDGDESDDKKPTTKSDIARLWRVG